MTNLPKGWAWARIGDICNLINGRAFKSDEWSSKGIPIIRIQNLNNVKKEFHYCDFPVEDKYLVTNGQLLFAWSGSFGAYIWTKGLAVLNQHIFKVVLDESCIHNIFLLHLLNHNIRTYEQEAHGTAGSLAHITKSKFENSVIPIPPLAEQHRIAAKIEELFSRLDAGASSLKTVKAQLTRYRHSVLENVFNGRLTAEWRGKHEGQAEPAPFLLQQIEKERTRKQMRKQKQPICVNTLNLTKLPPLWAWTTISAIAQSMKNGIYKPREFYSLDGIACLRMYNIQDGSIVWKDIKRMILTPEEVNEYKLDADDILVNRVNSRELVGKAAPISPDLETSVYESKNIRLRLFTDFVDSKYVSYWFQVFAQPYFNRNAQQTVGMASINQEQLGAMPLPLPPLAEQREIVEQIETCFFASRVMENAATRSMILAERLKTSILKKAFCGQLVPPDPNDEPASNLLSRIRSPKARREVDSRESKTQKPKQTRLEHYA